MTEKKINPTERDYRDFYWLNHALEIHKNRPIRDYEDAESKALYIEWLEFMIKEMKPILFPAFPKRNLLKMTNFK